MSGKSTGKFKLGWLVAASMLGLSACSSPDKLRTHPHVNPEDADVEPADTFEGFNRVMYKFNYGLDMVIIRPITQGYRFIVPQAGRIAVSNVVENLYSPVTFGNSVLQGDPQNSFATLWRFILNTTFGLGGVIDFAGQAGLHNRPADFGETMALCGVDSGPYLVLPFIGPSSVRDGIGRVGDAVMNPFTYTPYEVSIPYAAVSITDARSRSGKVIDDIYDNSIDSYETFRSAYLQKRAADIAKADASREKALERTPGK